MSLNSGKSQLAWLICVGFTLHLKLLQAQVLQVACGVSHNCVLLEDETIKCFGYGGSGAMGQGDLNDRGDEPGEMGDNLPTIDLGTGRRVERISAGTDFGCALLDDGTVKCWGGHSSGRLGSGVANNLGDEPGEMGNNLSSLDFGTGRTALQLSVGALHGCVKLDDSSVKCWGFAGHGQLGYGDKFNRGDEPGEMGDSLPTVALGTGISVNRIIAGFIHTCALLDDGNVKCWGPNHFGQLGYGDVSFRGDGPGEMGDNLPTIDLGTGRTAVQVAIGGLHTCALLDDATVKCWGSGTDGTLGDGATSNRGDGPGEMGDNLPRVDLGTGRTAVQISAHRSHSCALLDNGSVKCWGKGSSGELGYGDSNSRGDGPGEMGDSLPIIDLGTGKTPVQVCAGFSHSCALFDDTTVKCWGSGQFGKLGRGDILNYGDESGEMGDNLPLINFGSNITRHPTASPSVSPSARPSQTPTETPSRSPSSTPTLAPSRSPSTPAPSESPSTPVPSESPSTTAPTSSPTSAASSLPTTPAVIGAIWIGSTVLLSTIG